MPTDSFRGSIAALASAAAVNVETIRVYQRRGHLAEPPAPARRVRLYGPTDVDRVRFIKAAQRLGFSLTEVASLLALDDGAHCSAARMLAERKLRDVREKLRDLRRMESALKTAVADCASTRGTVKCPLIDSLRAVTATRGGIRQGVQIAK
jgi:MerR family mercuric resistance operon transcriptional regulator